jgi:transcriptional regulator GlxA family with amidase domain
MKHISILVPEGAILGAVEGPHKLFTEVNTILASMDRPPFFEIELVGLSKETRLNNGLYSVHPHKTIYNAGKTDLVIIPAPNGDVEKTLEMNRDFVPWIIEQHKGGAEVASLCLGAFLLAETGLLKGKKCATHWMSATAFRNMFPDVNLVAEKIITDEQGVYSSGGAYSYLNLILYLIEKYVGRDVAICCAKVFAIDIDRSTQSPFTMFRSQKDHKDDSIRQAQEYIERNFTEKITVEELASMLALGRRNLERRFKKATSNSIMEYIQRVKIEAAKLSLESSRENVNEVMYKVGYADRKAFRTTFKKITGLSPVQYKNKYNRQAAA